MTGAHAASGMIADYVAGALSPGMSLLIGSHLAFCPPCRGRAIRLEALAGALFADADPVPPGRRCLAKALSRLAGCGAEPVVEPEAPPLPRPVCRALKSPACDLAWTPAGPGLTESRLEGFAPDTVALMRAEPGAPLPDAGAALVLAGRLRDRMGVHSRGEVVLADGGLPRTADGTEECLCLVVVPGSVA